MILNVDQSVLTVHKIDYGKQGIIQDRSDDDHVGSCKFAYIDYIANTRKLVDTLLGRTHWDQAQEEHWSIILGLCSMLTS